MGEPVCVLVSVGETESEAPELGDWEPVPEFDGVPDNVAVLDRGRALDCRFGTVTTAAVRVRPDLVQCRAPP